MATGTLDVVNVLNRELREWNCPARTLAHIAGLSSGKLSSYLNEVTRVPVEDELKLRTKWAALKRLIDATKPLPLDLSKVGDISRSLDAFESGELQIVVTR